VFEGSIADRIVLTEILLSPGGEKLTADAAKIIAVLRAMPETKAQSPSDAEIEQFLQEYGNPRGMPEGWIRGHLTKSKPQLAIDVIRAFDKDFALERSLRRVKLVLGTLNVALGTLAAVLALLKFL
jgi:hypothetical protein